MKTIYDMKNIEMEVKRLGIPDIESECPKCKNPVTHYDYISNPVIGQKEPIIFGCSNCQYTWTQNIIIHSHIQLLKEKKEVIV